MLTRCVRCGRETTLVDGRLCPDCYMEVYGLGSFPKKVVVTVCTRCGAYRFQGRWFPAPLEASSIDDVVNEVLRLTLSLAFRPADVVEAYRVERVQYVRDQFHGDYALAEVVGRLRGLGVEKRMEYRVRVELVKRLCPQCFKKAGGAVEAILQVRGEGGRLTEEQRELVEELLDRLPDTLKEYIVEVVEQREGFDLILIDQDAAKAIASKIRMKLGARVVESWKVVGRRSDGRLKKRLTLSVRLPFFTRGSLVDLNGVLHRVEEIRDGYVYVRRVGGRRWKRITIDEAWKLLRKPRLERIVRVLIAAVTPAEIHLQKLGESFEYLELPRRSVNVENVELRPGVEASLIEYNGRYYILPSSES